MKTIISILLSFVILTQSFGVSLGDIILIDGLISHAQYHNKQYGDNVLVFISKHYGKLKAEHNTKHQEEKEDHEQLPFQQHTQLSSITVFILNTIKEDYTSPEFTDIKSNNFHYTSLKSSLYSKGLFQPPRHS